MSALSYIHKKRFQRAPFRYGEEICAVRLVSYRQPPDNLKA